MFQINNPIFSFTSFMVSRAINLAFSAPSARIFFTSSGFVSSSFFLSRLGEKVQGMGAGFIFFGCFAG
jgi:hypothetical protein